MVNRSMPALFVIAVVLAMPSASMAQRWGRGPFPGSGACFFQDVDFRGEYFCIAAGENIGRVPDDMNDRISSIRIFGRAEVAVFRDVRFQGGAARFGRSIRDLRDEHWNDRISSMRVEIPGRDGDVRGRDGDFRDRRDDRDNRRDDRDDQRDGRRDGGRSEGDTARAREIVRRAYLSVLQREPDPAAEGWVDNVIRNHWSEADLERELRNSPEYRDKFTLTRARAQDIVRRAYLNVFKREPDPGAAGWVDNVLKNKWTQDDLERELRNTPEYRQKNAR
jgi:hypothetical protein